MTGGFMNITLYKNMSAPNVLDKRLTDELLVQGDYNTTVDILNPFLRIKSTVDIMDYNYLYIPDLKRFYFIQNIIAYRNKIFDVYTNVDVLGSWKAEIKRCYGIVTSGEDSNPFMNGYISSVDVRKSVSKYTFENPFTDGQYILIGVRGVRGES